MLGPCPVLRSPPCGKGFLSPRSPACNVLPARHALHYRPRLAFRVCASSGDQDIGSSDGLSLLLECDGVLTDIHIDGHMAAFNCAFAELGYDCATWTPAIYHDLLRSADGTGPGMVREYFGRVGWPQFLPTSERDLFCSKVYALKAKCLGEMAQARQLPLRPGVADLLRDAADDGAALGLITQTNSLPSMGVSDAVLEALGPDLAHAVKVFPTLADDAAANGSSSSVDGGDEDEGGGEGRALSMEQSLAQAQAKAKARGAQEFAAAAAQDLPQGSTGVVVAPNLIAAAAAAGEGEEGSGGGAAGSLLSPSYIAAVNLAMGSRAGDCAVAAASSAVMQAAKSAGALSVAVPPSLSARGKFDAADITFDGFGPGGGATWPRIKAALLRRREEQQRQQQQGGA